MSSFSIGAGIAPAADIARLASRAEAAGFDAIWTQEMFHDPFLPLASAATGTSRITLGTSIALAFVRFRRSTSTSSQAGASSLASAPASSGSTSAGTASPTASQRRTSASA